MFYVIKLFLYKKLSFFQLLNLENIPTVTNIGI